MPEIIVFGDIDITPLRMSIDGSKEMTISGKWPRRIRVSAGSHTIVATTMSKLDRMSVNMADGVGKLGAAITEASNTTLGGTIDLDPDDVWLFQVKQGLTKSKVTNRVMDMNEAREYVDMGSVLDYGERAPGEKNKWVVLLLCLFLGFLGVHRFYERKIVTGIIYLLTLGLFGIGILYDLVKIWQRSG